jgi:hypothetical protein
VGGISDEEVVQHPKPSKTSFEFSVGLDLRNQTEIESRSSGRRKNNSSNAVAVGAGGHGLLVSDLPLPALELDVLLRVVVDVETERGGVDVAVAPDEESTEDRLSQNVEHTVEGSLGVGGDEVGTLADAPGDGVESPQDGGQGAADQEGAADVAAQGVGVLARFPAEHVEDVEEGDAAEDEVAPLVAGADEGAGETGDDHDFVDEDDEEDRGPRHAGGKEQVGEKQRGGDDPVDVSEVEVSTGPLLQWQTRYTHLT